MRRRTLALVIALPVTAIGLLLFATRSADEHQSVRTPADYASLLDRFPRELRAIAPPAIPAGAADIRSEFRSAHGMGPSSTWLTASFAVPPSDAAAMLSHAKDVAAPWADSRRSEPSAVTLTRGDKLTSLRINPATGQVTIELRVN